MYQINGLTEHGAEYQALLGVLKYIAPGSRATIFTHSHEVWGAFNGVQVRDPLLAELKAVIVPRLSRQRKSHGVSRESGDAGDEGDANFG